MFWSKLTFLRRYLFFCFPKFPINSLKIELDITKNPQKFRMEICSKFDKIITLQLSLLEMKTSKKIG